MADSFLEAIRRAAESRTANEPAHDWLHVLRVESLGARIAAAEEANCRVVRAAALLHEVFTLPKNHPDSPRAGDLCAEVARDILSELDVTGGPADEICYCIQVHAFSAGIEPETLEAKVLQDADRLDAIGAIGIARCFATCASMGRPFYDGDDPFAENRRLDDKSYGLDHFYLKLLRIPDRLHTPEGRRLGWERKTFLEAYLERLGNELL